MALISKKPIFGITNLLPALTIFISSFLQFTGKIVVTSLSAEAFQWCLICVFLHCSSMTTRSLLCNGLFCGTLLFSVLALTPSKIPNACCGVHTVLGGVPADSGYASVVRSLPLLFGRAVATPAHLPRLAWKQSPRGRGRLWSPSRSCLGSLNAPYRVRGFCLKVGAPLGLCSRSPVFTQDILFS